jgi:Protein of unknown function (DUF642)
MNSKNIVIGLATVVLSIAVTHQAQAVNLINNGSFESTSSNRSLPSSSTTISGWTVVAKEIAWLPSGAFGVTTPFGNSLIDLTGLYDAKPYGGITQTINTTVGQAYNLSFYLGNYQSYSGSISVLAAAGSTNQTFIYNPVGTSGSQWSPFNLNFTATTATTPITFTGITSTRGLYIGLDNVAVNAANSPTSVPEPFTIVGTIIGGTAALRLRKKLKSATINSASDDV